MDASVAVQMMASFWDVVKTVYRSFGASNGVASLAMLLCSPDKTGCDGLKVGIGFAEKSQSIPACDSNREKS
jgi:hypothetical protein